MPHKRFYVVGRYAPITDTRSKLLRCISSDLLLSLCSYLCTKKVWRGRGLASGC
ncbi:hypothetical protein HanIR_Chr14g0726021 [Helianthus annuus]|nr:hypothetical protein HanIR_Chr14g0726021 [Helianthus annuus]